MERYFQRNQGQISMICGPFQLLIWDKFHGELSCLHTALEMTWMRHIIPYWWRSCLLRPSLSVRTRPSLRQEGYWDRPRKGQLLCAALGTGRSLQSTSPRWRTWCFLQRLSGRGRGGVPPWWFEDRQGMESLVALTFRWRSCLAVHFLFWELLFYYIVLWNWVDTTFFYWSMCHF